MVKVRIAIDFSSLDHLSIRNGQYLYVVDRYVVDLVRGLIELQPEAEFTLLGSSPSPVAELRTLVDSPSWRYLQFSRCEGVGPTIAASLASRGTHCANG